MNALITSLLRKTAYFCAGIICLIAIFIATVYLSTPLLNQHRADIEKWATDLFKVPVTISSMKLSWAHYQPEINLYGVTASNADTHKPVLTIKKISVYISVPRSLWNMSVVPAGVLLSGSKIKVTETVDGQYVLQGFPAFGNFDDKPFEAETSVPTMLTWLSQQPDITLDDIHLRYKQSTGEVRIVSLSELSLVNNGIRHTILGKAILEQPTPIDISIAVQWKGDSTDLAKMNARIYLYATGVSLPQWLKDKEWKGWHVETGIVSAKFWLRWSGNQWQKLQTNFQALDVVLKTKNNKTTQTINRLSGDVGWRREGDNWVIAGDNILVDLPTRLWPVSNFYLTLKPAPIPVPVTAVVDEGAVSNVEASGSTEGQWIPVVLNTGYINVSDVLPILFATPDLVPPALQTTLQDLKLTGSIETLSIVFPPDLADWKAGSITTSVKDISFVPVGKMPGMKNISGKLVWRNAEGTFDVLSQALSFVDDRVFLNTIDFEQVKGQLAIKHTVDQSTWVVSSPGLQLSNEDINADVKGSFTFAAGQALPTADLTASYSAQSAQHITRYLPLKIFSAELNEWLSKAFHTGSVTAGQAQVKGNLEDFPFHSGNGIFLITGDVHNVDLKFADEWPIITHINGKLTFAGAGMQVETTSGETVGVPFGHIYAEIPDFHAETSMLHIKADPITSDFANALSYVHASPLESSIGKMFGDVKLSGPITLALTLDIPLDNPDTTKVAGVIGIKNGVMSLEPWNLSITKLNGDVNFTESTTDATNIQGILFDKPLQFSLATLQQKNDSIVRATFNNNLAIKDLEQWLKIPMSNFIQGATNVNGQLDLTLDKPMNLQITSDLVGVKVALPDEYGKMEEKAVPFTATLIIDPLKPLKAQFVYGKLVSAALLISRDAKNKMALDGATIAIGSTQADWPATNGLYLTGTFDTLDWDTISKYKDQANAGFGAHKRSAASTGVTLEPGFLKLVSVKANKVNLFGQSLSNVNVNVKPDSSSWNANITSNQITGQATIPQKFDASSSLSATFSRIDINTSNSKSTASQVNASTLPAMTIVSNSTTINGMNFGKITIKTSPKSGGLSIDSVRISSPFMDLQADGDWNSGGADATSLEGVLNTPSVHNMLMDLGFDARNLMAQNGQLNFDLSWQGAPYTPALVSMDGHARLNVGKGRIVDIGAENGAKMDLGRMLSLFSLQTIPRRLSLDFSDVFQKGYSFDSLKGDFKMDNGNIITNNLAFDGPVARISINGRIGLNQKDYNLVLGITPYVTSSIPVAATLLTGNPLIGLGVLAVNTVVGSTVSKVTTKYYGVTGPWNNPAWKAVSGP